MNVESCIAEKIDLNAMLADDMPVACSPNSCVTWQKKDRKKEMTGSTGSYYPQALSDV